VCVCVCVCVCKCVRARDVKQLPNAVLNRRRVGQLTATFFILSLDAYPSQTLMLHHSQDINTLGHVCVLWRAQSACGASTGMHGVKDSKLHAFRSAATEAQWHCARQALLTAPGMWPPCAS
jgi:hypothetical protein